MKSLELNNVIKKFSGFNLGPLNFELENGRVYGFIGPNGAGKTTTIQTIYGLINRNEGSIKVLGEETNPNKTEWKHNIGYVGDVNSYYENWTVRKNLDFIKGFYPGWDDDYMMSLVSRFELALEKKVKSLSTGNRIKLGIITAMSYKPKVLLLDEPTSGLDPIIRAELIDTLFEYMENEENTILYSTHIISELERIADELIFIHNGNIVEREIKDELVGKWKKVEIIGEINYRKFNNKFNYKTDGKKTIFLTDNLDELKQILSEFNYEMISESNISLDEAAVEIIKRSKNVAFA